MPCLKSHLLPPLEVISSRSFFRSFLHFSISTTFKPSTETGWMINLSSLLEFCRCFSFLLITHFPLSFPMLPTCWWPQTSAHWCGRLCLRQLRTNEKSALFTSDSVYLWGLSRFQELFAKWRWESFRHSKRLRCYLVNCSATWDSMLWNMSSPSVAWIKIWWAIEHQYINFPYNFLKFFTSWLISR